MTTTIVNYSCDLLQEFPNIINRIKELNQDCFDFPTDCCITIDCKNRVYFLIEDNKMDVDLEQDDIDENMRMDVEYSNVFPEYTEFDENDSSNYLNFLNINPQIIKSMFIEVNGVEGSELYNVCTYAEHRNKGYMKRLLEEYLKQNPQKLIWLGIDSTQNIETIKGLYNFYSSIGFCNPVLTKNTGIFVNTISHNVIGLLFNYNCRVKSSKIFDIILKTINSKEIEYKFRISLETCLRFKEYLKTPLEVGGILLLKPNNVLEIDNNSIVYETDRKCEIYVPTGFFNFHTHPMECYETFQCNYGWVSIPDIKYILSRFITIGIHYVISIEGIYSIQLTPSIRRYLNNASKEELDKFYANIIKTFLKKEQCRQETELFIVYTEFINFINNYTFKELQEQPLGEGNDFFVFKAVLYNWDYIRKNDGFIDSLYS